MTHVEPKAIDQNHNYFLPLNLGKKILDKILILLDVMKTIQEIESGVQSISICDIEDRKKTIRSMIRMLMYEVELLDSKMNQHIVYLQNNVVRNTIEDLVVPMEINNIRVGSFVKMMDRKDMYYNKIGKVVNMSDFFIVINMAFGNPNETAVYISRQRDEVTLIVT